MNLFSFDFAFIFIIFWAFYYYFRFAYITQKLILLGFSYLFLYLCTRGSVENLALLINIFFAIYIWLIAKILAKFHSKILLIFGIFSIVLSLGFFKYIKFFDPISQSLESHFDNSLLISNALPLGISYYSFMAITYLVQVFNKQTKPQSMLNTLIYLSFFVTITSGPIVMANDFFKMLNKRKNDSKTYIRSDEIFTLFTLAFIKVLLVANWTSKAIEPIFKAPSIHEPHFLVIGCVGFSVMLYAQFSGFIDFVRGLGMLLGYPLPKNFRHPFSATNLRDFWRRWHITLMKFFMKFIYIPLGGSRKGVWRKYLNIAIVFLISGIWHGSGSEWLKYAIWGLIHAFGMVAFLLYSSQKMDILRFATLKQFITFMFVSFSWIFFGFGDTGLYEANEYFKALFVGFNEKIIGVILAVFASLYLYNKINFHCVIKSVFRHLNGFLQVVFFVILGILIFKLMPNEIPNFMYGGF